MDRVLQNPLRLLRDMMSTDRNVSTIHPMPLKLFLIELCDYTFLNIVVKTIFSFIFSLYNNSCFVHIFTNLLIAFFILLRK